MTTRWTKACAGSAGSKPTLTAIEAQLKENNDADREGRAAEVIPVQCGFCQGYHKVMQSEEISGTTIDDFKVDPVPPVETPQVDPELIEQAAQLVVNPDNLPVDDTDDAEIQALLNSGD